MIGPPTAPPKVLRINTGRSIPERLLKKSLAVVAVFRLAKKSAPCHSLLPLFVTSAIWAPEDRPWFAFAFVVVTRNSSIASAFKRITGWLWAAVNWEPPLGICVGPVVP